MKFKSDIEVEAGIKDSSGAIGTAGQVLSSTGSNVSWIDAEIGVARDVQNRVKAGVAINKGQAVYVTSADGTNIIVGLASNTSEATSSKTLGLLNATVAANGFADVVQIGKLTGLNTIGAVVGDPVWLGTNGNIIYGLANKPYAPAHLVYIGVVTRVSANNGEIFITVQNGFELKEIHDVDIITNVPINGDVLGYDGTLWVNKTIAEWLGYTPADQAITISTTAPLSGGGNLSANRTLSIAQANATTNGYLSSADWTNFNNKQTALNGTGFVKASGTTISYDNSTYVPTSRTITINGVTQDLSANQAWTVSGGIDGSGTVNTLSKFTGTTTIGDSQIKDSGTSVSIGYTTNPNTYKLDVNGDVNINTDLYVSGTFPYTIKAAGGVNVDDALGVYWKTDVGGIGGTLAGIGQSSSGLDFYTNSSLLAPKLRILANGNVTIGTLAGSGTRVVTADSSGNLSTTPGSVAPRYTSYIVVSHSSYTNICTITGDALASAIKMSFQGTSGGVVVNTTAEILVNHSQDISVTSNSGFYSQLNIRVISNNDETYSIEAQVANAAQATGLNIEVFPLNNESVVFQGTLITAGTVLVHTTRPGIYITSSDNNAAAITSGGNIYAQGSVGIGGTFIPNQKLQVAGNISVGTTLPMLISNDTTETNFVNSIYYPTDNTGYGFAIGKIVAGIKTKQFVVRDTGNVGVGTPTPGVRFVNTGGVNTDGPTFGSGTVGSDAILSANGLYGLYTGVSNLGHVWQQVQRNDGSTAVYPLSLQTSGGSVLIGTITDAGYKLDVAGEARATSITTTASAQANAILGTVSSSWGGTLYPTLYGSATDRWVMHINPHVSYTQNGVNGFTGSMTGSTIRMASDPAANSYWDIGVGTNSAGNDKFSIGRVGSSFLAVNNSGNVGIGTLSPARKLTIESASTTWDTAPSIAFYDNVVTTNARNWVVGNVATDYGSFNIASSTAQGGAPTTSRLTINKDGNVGIGTTGPKAKLDVEAYTSFMSLSSGINSEATTADQQIGGIDFRKHYALAIGASIRLLQSGGVNNYSTSHLAFYTNDGSTAFNTVPPEKMRITSNGTVLINTQTDAGYRLDVNGTGRFSGKITASELITYGIYGPDKSNIDALNTKTDGTAGFISLVGHSGNTSSPYRWGGISGGKSTAVGDGQYGGYLSFWTTSGGENGQVASASYERMRIASNGNVGIGTTSPAYKFDLNSNAEGISFKTYTSTTNNSEHTYSKDAGFFIDSYQSVGGAPYTKTTDLIANADAGADSQLRMFTATTGGNPTERMRITSGGNVGIGTTTVPNTLSVAMASSTTGKGISLTSSAGVEYARFGVINSTVDNTSFIGSVSNNNFAIYANNLERMRVFGNGNISLGSSTPSDNGYRLQVNGGQFGTYLKGGDLGVGSRALTVVRADNAEAFYVRGDGLSFFNYNVTAPGFFNSSDIRLKEIVNYDYNISDIKPISYLWKDLRDNKKHIGYSAQEVQKVMPDAVNEGEDGMLSVNYIEVLVAKIAELENRIKQLEK